ncbi:MAG: hypothetical protein WED05_10020 [Candidatus Atabeyarchaeum deiterrae]
MGRGVIVVVFILVLAAGGMFVSNYKGEATATVSASGSVVNGNEELGFTLSGDQTWLACWAFGAKWLVNGQERLTAGYSYSLDVSGQNLVQGSVVETVTFKAAKSGVESTRWASTGRGDPGRYMDAKVDQVSDIATALSFSATNGTVSLVVFQVRVDVSARGKTSGSTLTASSGWLTFTGNQVSYMAYTTKLGALYYPSSVSAVYPSGGGSGTLANVQSDDGTYYSVALGDVDTYTIVQMGYTGLPTPSTQYPYFRVEIEVKANLHSINGVQLRVMSGETILASWDHGSIGVGGTWIGTFGDNAYSGSYVSGGAMTLRVYAGSQQFAGNAAYDYMRIRIIEAVSWLDTLMSSASAKVLVMLAIVALVVLLFVRRRKA